MHASQPCNIWYKGLLPARRLACSFNCGRTRQGCVENDSQNIYALLALHSSCSLTEPFIGQMMTLHSMQTGSICSLNSVYLCTYQTSFWLFQAAEKERARTTKPRQAEKVRMSDLREANKAELDTDDMEARQKAVQPVGFIPSGGLTGFRVASDLAKMDFAPRDDLKEEPEPEEEKPKHVTPAWLKPAPATESTEGS